MLAMREINSCWDSSVSNAWVYWMTSFCYSISKNFSMKISFCHFQGSVENSFFFVWKMAYTQSLMWTFDFKIFRHNPQSFHLCSFVSHLFHISMGNVFVFVLFLSSISKVFVKPPPHWSIDKTRIFFIIFPFWITWHLSLTCLDLIDLLTELMDRWIGLLF